VPPDEIRHSIDCVVDDGGDVNDLAHMLLHGGGVLVVPRFLAQLIVCLAASAGRL
jgi:hypothetical protein